MLFNQIGEGVYTIQPENTAMAEKLPVGNYNISIHPDYGYIVQRTKDFVLPAKIYGGNNHLVEVMKDRFLNERVGKVTTASLSGLKGSGKTLAAKQLSIRCREEHGISTFLVSNSFSGSGFNEFLMKLQSTQDDPIIVLIDEFEKIYQDQDDINRLLSLLDGTATLHMMVLLTMNTSLEERRFEFFKNRPGRAYFNKHFETCPEPVIREYCADNLKYPELTEQVVGFSYRFTAFTLDLLTTLVSEINLTKGKVPLEDITDYVNIKPDISAESAQYLTMCYNTESGLPLSTSEVSHVRPDYDFASEILSYSPTNLTVNFPLDSPHYARIDKAYKQSLAGGEGSVTTINGIFFETTERREVTRNEDGSESSVKHIPTGYRAVMQCGIKREDDEENANIDVLGHVDLGSRKVTFVTPPIIGLTLVLSSINRRRNNVRRLVL